MKKIGNSVCLVDFEQGVHLKKFIVAPVRRTLSQISMKTWDETVTIDIKSEVNLIIALATATGAPRHSRRPPAVGGGSGG